MSLSPSHVLEIVVFAPGFESRNLQHEMPVWRVNKFRFFPYKSKWGRERGSAATSNLIIIQRSLVLRTMRTSREMFLEAIEMLCVFGGVIISLR